jgi:predicted Fe-Mo cluster-binding NifX family protein
VKRTAVVTGLVKRIAVACEESGGMEDVVASIYGRCVSFTIIDVEDGSVDDVKIQPNIHASRSEGVGPLVSEMLQKLNVDLAIAAEFGPRALLVLREVGIKTIVKPRGTTVRDAIREHLENT